MARKKSNRKAIIARLDNIVSKIVRKKDPACVVCGSTNRLGNGHLFSRRKYITRWDIHDTGNCHTQCWACNFKHEYDPWPYFRWYLDTYGREELDRLSDRYGEHRTYKDDELEELYTELREYLDAMGD